MCFCFDESTLSVNGIVKHLNAYGYLKLLNNELRSLHDIYCGITNNLDATLTRHRIDSYLCVVNCGTMDKASTVERKMGLKGYDIGEPPHDGNGAADDTIYVYIFQKTSETDPAL